MLQSLLRGVLRKRIKCIMVCLTASSMLFTGCASNWRYSWDLGSEQSSKEDTGQTKTEKTIDLSISEQGAGSPSLGYSFEIHKDVRNASYRKQRTEWYSTDQQYRHRENNREESAQAGAAIGALSLGAAGVIWVYAKNPNPGDKGANALAATLLGVLGVCVGALVGYGIGSAAGTPEKTEYTGETRRRSLRSDDDWIISGKNTDATDIPASGIPVVLTSTTLTLRASGQEGKRISIPSNAIGAVNVKITGGLENWSEDRSELISRLESDNRMRSIKLTARPAILANLLEQLKSESHSFKLQSALDKGTDYVAVNNAEKTVYLSGYGVSSRAFETACEVFIGKKVNRHIKRVRVTFKDMDSRSGIAGIAISCETESRTPQSLLSNYFDQPLLDQYTTMVAGFESGSFSRSTSSNGELVADLYVPSLLSVTFTHPAYGTIEQEIYLTEEALLKVLYIPKKGTGGSIRVE